MNVAPSLRAALIGLLLLALPGCSFVTSSEILGEPTTDKMITDLALDGAWSIDDGVLFVQRISGHELKVASVDWEEGRFEMQEATVLFTTDDEVTYVVLLNPDTPEGKPEFLFCRVLMATESTIVIIPANPDTFQKAVEDGALAGNVKREQYSTITQLTATTEDLNRFVDPKKVGEQFDLDLPIVLKRLTRPTETEVE